MRALLAAAIVLGCLAGGAVAHAAAPRVVVSVKPLHSLAAAVMAGVGKPEVLIKGNGSLHTYSLRPSEARALDEAEVVFWVGPEFESFLDKPLGALTAKAVVVPLITAPGVKVLPARQGGLWEHSEDGSDSHGSDGHVWLDYANAKAIALAMAETLTSMDIANGPRYRNNAVALAVRLDALNDELRVALAPVKNKPFVVFHDAYQYFEVSYGLQAVGSVTVSPDRAPGARRVADVKEKIIGLGAACIFAEPQFEPKMVSMLVKTTRARTAVLDPEGSTLPAGPDLYFNLMRGLANNLVKCLGAP